MLLKQEHRLCFFIRIPLSMTIPCVMTCSPVSCAQWYQEDLPPVNTPMITDRMGYHMREGKHNIVLYDWQQYVAFADKYLK